MSKELVRPRQFGKTETIWDDTSLLLNEEQKAELANLYEGIASNYKHGTVVKGKIITKNSDGILVDINFKSDGLIPLHEFNEHELRKFTVGGDIEVIIDDFEDVDGNIVLSYEKAKELKAWQAIMKLYEEGKPVEGVVTHKVKGGLSVDIGVPAFLPGSQVDLQRVSDFDQYIGQTVTGYILKVNQKRVNVIMSRRKYLHELRSEARKRILDTLSVDQIIQGVVKNITNYGVFIDIGGVDGLLHITDMTWGRIAHPSEIVKIGDTVTVKVLSFDKANEKISLGMKQLSENPWAQLDPAIQIGSKIKGRISSITDYGLFVEVAKGVEGLVHISEISWTDRITDLSKHFNVSDEIEAVVVSLDKDNRRMSLSIKQLEKSPWDAAVDQFQVNQHVKGTISNITDFGIFVQLAPGVDGLVHISDLSWTEHVKHPADIFKKGDEVQAVILDINKQKRKISLGIKQLTENPWENIAQKYPIGSLVQGEVSKLTDFGAFIKLPTGIEGLLHISELPHGEKVENFLKVGQIAEFRVVKVSPDERRVGLSMKNSLTEEQEVKKVAPVDQTTKKARSKKEETPAQGGTRVKSQLQLELEKHAARRNDDHTED
jgi:small subunit ribosomal protein S1